MQLLRTSSTVELRTLPKIATEVLTFSYLKYAKVTPHVGISGRGPVRRTKTDEFVSY
jgi:hypothetical protein